MKIIKHISGKEAYNKDGVIGRKLISKDAVETVHLELAPGKSLPVHKTPVDVLFYVLEGNGEISIGEEKQLVEPDTLVESPKDIPHGLYNSGDTLFRVLVVKTPKP